jgi:hypothetical protein
MVIDGDCDSHLRHTEYHRNGSCIKPKEITVFKNYVAAMSTVLVHFGIVIAWVKFTVAYPC